MNQYLLVACIGLAAVVIVLSAALMKSSGIASSRSVNPMDSLNLGTANGNTVLPDPNNSGPHQINIVIDDNLKFCVGTKPDGSGPPYWVATSISGRRYLVILSNKQCP